MPRGKNKYPPRWLSRRRCSSAAVSKPAIESKLKIQDVVSTPALAPGASVRLAKNTLGYSTTGMDEEFEGDFRIKNISEVSLLC